MLFIKEDGTFGDTHESFNDEREEQIAEIGDEIIERFEEEFVEGCDIHTYSDYSGECCAPGVYIDSVDSPNYDKLLDETIEEYITKDMDDDFIEDLKDYVKDNVSSESDLIDRAEENYEPYEPDYDDYDD